MIGGSSDAAAGRRRGTSSEAEQDEAAVTQDIVSLIQAMHSQLAQELHRGTVPGYDSFGHVALAYGLPSLYMDLLEMRLKVSYSCVCLLP